MSNQMTTDIFASNDIAGFIEHSVEVMAVMEKIKIKISEIYEKYGFQPFATRLVEDADVLSQKGIDSKELFSLNFLSRGTEYIPGEDRRILALRFDLTVPLARYIGQHSNVMKFPFKRYQIQKVYRAEHAKVATGRYNEFYQSDIDVIGQGSIDLTHDSEFPAIICDIFQNIFNLERFVIRISNRKFLEGLFREYGVNDVTLIKQCIKIIDDIEKVSEQETIDRLHSVGLDMEKGRELLDFFREISSMNPMKTIPYLRGKFSNSLILQGIDELETVFEGIGMNGVSTSHFKFDPSIARGLDYYTGTVYETLLLDYPELGSVCSGGRYEDLVGTLARNKNIKYPGVGISIGLSRLVPTLIMKGHLSCDDYKTTSIMVSCQDKKFINKYIALGSMLRRNGHNVEIFQQRNKKLAYQLEYAEKKGIRYVLIANSYEFDEGKINVRNMITKETTSIALSELLTYFASMN